jgi:hypothetical protein
MVPLLLAGQNLDVYGVQEPNLLNRIVLGLSLE